MGCRTPCLQEEARHPADGRPLLFGQTPLVSPLGLQLAFRREQALQEGPDGTMSHACRPKQRETALLQPPGRTQAFSLPVLKELSLALGAQGHLLQVGSQPGGCWLDFDANSAACMQS